MNTRKFKEKTCADCGATFIPRANTQQRCDACRPKHDAKRRKEYNEHRRKARSEYRNRCLYCGKKTNSKYCESCIRNRFDAVHAMFGTTNGWDKMPRKHVEVPDGWRGRIVMGGRSSMRKNNLVM